TLASDNLTGIVTANPSSVLKLVRLIEEHTYDLLQILTGNASKWTLRETKKILPELRNITNQSRLAHLVHSYTKYGRLTPDDVFPVLSAIATWTGGSCGIALRQLKSYLPTHKNKEVKIVEYGYGSSEFMGTVNVDAINNRCLPQLTHHVYEFVNRDDWIDPGADDSKADNNVYQGVHELIPGKEYHTVVTTQSGLYRYNINDIVRAGSMIGQCATISFLQKGRGVTNITGEKLSEHQLIDAMSDAIQTHPVVAGGYMALANEEQSRYDIYLESDKLELFSELSAQVDKKLRTLNIEYEEKRASERLKHIHVYGLSSDACEVIKGWCVSQGIREAQYKPTVLAYARDWAEKLKPLLLKNQS
ncbi:MAG: GH3 auxin-responsive promoter family protein, partial [Gammaproteobacteria bacterium]|nr:GH3 auxin-responsive promoter family protein [Gammaproteobacteria bacterium]